MPTPRYSAHARVCVCACALLLLQPKVPTTPSHVAGVVEFRSAFRPSVLSLRAALREVKDKTRRRNIRQRDSSVAAAAFHISGHRFRSAYARVRPKCCCTDVFKQDVLCFLATSVRTVLFLLSRTFFVAFFCSLLLSRCTNAYFCWQWSSRNDVFKIACVLHFLFVCWSVSLNGVLLRVVPACHDFCNLLTYVQLCGWCPRATYSLRGICFSGHDNSHLEHV